MKLLLVIYSGAQSRLVPELLEAHEAGGYTELGDAHGTGTTGPRVGTRAWPGNARIYFSIVPAGRTDALVAALRAAAGTLAPQERLHAAVLPTETFF
ncbi:MAG TPA: hypothetical protein VK939_09375 [Longimicrobiales bacterium]|nr:hypothetical protein [Longimicrobiales bacterium]